MSIIGPDFPGNYTRLQRIELKTPVFPLIVNQRSMVNVDRLCLFTKIYIDLKVEGMVLLNT